MGCQSYSSLRYWNTQYKCLFLTWNRDDAYSSVPSPPKQITKSILLVNSSFSTDQDKSAWIHKISTEFYILQVFHCYTEFYAVDITYLLQMFWFAFGVPGTLGFLSTLHHQTQPFPHIQPCFSPFKNKINSALYLIKAILIWLKNWAGYISEGTKELKIKKNVLLQKHFNCKKYWDHVNGFYFHLSKVTSSFHNGSLQRC